MTFELNYLELYYQLNRCYWNEIVLNSKRECDPLERQLHILAKSLKINSPKNDYKRTHIVDRALVDYHPDIVAMSNFLSRKENYLTDQEIDIEKMSTDYLLLMALRDRLAVKQNYSSYVSMVLKLEGLKFKHLHGCLNKWLDQQIETSKALISKYSLSLDHWYSGLRQINCDCELNHIKLIDKLTSLFPESRDNLTIHRNPSDRTGYAVEVSEGEVWINVQRVDTLFDMSVFFHQMGHGLAHALDQSEGLNRIYTNFYEELTGILVERFMEKLLSEEAQVCLKDIRKLQYTRFGIEALFELELWFSDTSPEDLFRANYQKLLSNLEQMSVHMMNSLHITEPLYMYNYVLADIVAEKIIDDGPDSLEELAAYLTNDVFAGGDDGSWLELLGES